MRPPSSRRPAGRPALLAVLAPLALLATACGDASGAASGDEPPAVVVTTPVLGAVVRQVVGDAAPVTVLLPNGTDPHDWRPSARDVEAMDRALLVVSNGLDLEEGLEDALAGVRADGVPTFEASTFVPVRTAGEAAEHEEADGHGAADPHLWMTAENMALVADALTGALADLGLDVQATGTAAAADLRALDGEVAGVLEIVPPERRRLVSGHDSLGYFADHYGFEVVGTVVPGLSSQGAVSAGDLAALERDIRDAGVPVVFTELGTPATVVSSIAADTGAKVVPLGTHTLPAEGTYRAFLLEVAGTVAGALR